MSKAEEKAKEYAEKFILTVDHQGDVEEAYIDGYHQAEKDLKLTWEDMMIIHKCIKDAMNYHLYKMMEGMEGQKVVYQGVLKRFNENKQK